MEIEQLLRLEMPAALLHTGSVQKLRKVCQVPSLCGTDLAWPDLVGAPDHLGDGPEAEHSHDLPQFLCDEAHKVHDIFRLSTEAAAQLLILRGDADRAGILRADPHHHAAHTYQRSCGEGELLRSQQSGYGHITPAHEFAVRFQHDPLPKTILHKGVMRLGKPQFPGQSGVMHGGCRGCPCPTVIAGHQNGARTGFGNARGNGSDPCFRHQLYADPGLLVGVFQIVDQLGQILYGINVMMRRRGD